MENSIGKVNTYEEAMKLYKDSGVKFHWLIAVYETGFYSFTSVPVPILGDSEGFFTYDEIEEIGKEFSKIDQSQIPRKTSEIQGLEYLVLSQALTPERMAEYLNIKYGTSSTK